MEPSLRPFVTVYSEVSADGKSTHRRGASSKPMMSFEDEHIRRYRHELRARSDAIMVGSNTVRLDNPHLTVRDAAGPSPLRVVPCSMADLPLTSHIFSDEGRTLLAVSKAAPKERLLELQSRGVKVVSLGEHKVDLVALLDCLHSLGVNSLIVEGGATLLSAFFRARLVDRLIVQHLPVVFGGDDTPAMVGGAAVATIDEAIMMRLGEVRTIGNHAVIIYERR